MDIAYCCDDRYAKPMMVSCLSLIENAKVPLDLVIHIIDGGISENNKLKMVSLFASKNIAHHFYAVDPVINSLNSHTGKFSIAICYRLLIPRLLGNIDKVIYLDCDTVVLGDIAELWNIDISAHALAAVAENLISQLRSSINNKTDYYFNSGVIVFNLNAIRLIPDIEQKLLNFILHNNCIYPDQDALNHFFKLKTYILHPKFNVTGCVTALSAKYTKEDINDAVLNPYVIHYVGNNKPWDYPLTRYENYKDIYWHYYNLLPDRDLFSLSIEAILRYKKIFNNFKLYVISAVLVDFLFKISRVMLYMFNKQYGVSGNKFKKCQLISFSKKYLKLKLTYFDRKTRDLRYICIYMQQVLSIIAVAFLPDKKGRLVNITTNYKVSMEELSIAQSIYNKPIINHKIDDKGYIPLLYQDKILGILYVPFDRLKTDISYDVMHTIYELCHQISFTFYEHYSSDKFNLAVFIKSLL